MRIDELYPSHKYTFPDLIPPADSQIDIGVEVTRAIESKEGQKRKWITQNFGENKTVQEINSDRENHYHSLKLKVLTIGDTIVGPGYMYNSNSIVKIIIEKFERKLE